MIDNKYLRKTYQRLSQIFGDTELTVETEDESESKMKDKTSLLNGEARTLVAIIDINNKIIGELSKVTEFEDNISYYRQQKEIMLLQKENIRLDLEYSGKMDFIGQYEQRVKLSKEVAKEELRNAKQNVASTILMLEQQLPSIPDGTKEKALTIAMLHEYHVEHKKLNDREFTSVYKRLVDMVVRNNQFLKNSENQNKITV